MRVKMFKAKTVEELELEINIWLSNNSYKVARISHSGCSDNYTAMVLYQHMMTL